MLSKLDKSSHKPLYMQLAEIIEGAIHRGKYHQGSKLPSEQELMKMFEVSRVTVRQTLQYLTVKGIVVRSQGIGTFVNRQIFSQTVSDIMGFYPSLQSKGIDPIMRIIEYKVISPDNEVRKLLLLQEGEQVLHYIREYSIGQSVLVITHVYIPNSIAKNWTMEQAAEKASYRLIQENAEITISNSTLKIRASLATKEIAKMLKAKPGSSVLELMRLTFSSDHIPVEYSIFSFRGDSYELTTRITAGQDGLQISEQE